MDLQILCYLYVLQVMKVGSNLLWMVPSLKVSVKTWLVKVLF